MIKSNISISEVKDKIKKMQGENVEVTLNLGRNKTVRFYGKLDGIYPALFKVSPRDGEYKGKTVYSYSDYLCGQVKLLKVEQN